MQISGPSHLGLHHNFTHFMVTCKHKKERRKKIIHKISLQRAFVSIFQALCKLVANSQLCLYASSIFTKSVSIYKLLNKILCS